jgi:hypothetical protein
MTNQTLNPWYSTKLVVFVRSSAVPQSLVFRTVGSGEKCCRLYMLGQVCRICSGVCSLNPHSQRGYNINGGTWMVVALSGISEYVLLHCFWDDATWDRGIVVTLSLVFLNRILTFIWYDCDNVLSLSQLLLTLVYLYKIVTFVSGIWRTLSYVYDCDIVFGSLVMVGVSHLDVTLCPFGTPGMVVTLQDYVVTQWFPWCASCKSTIFW